MKKSYIILGIIILIAIILIFNYINNPLQEETKDYSWQSDSIQLLRHEITGVYGCFGCSEPGESQALCIDPIIEMKPSEETAERYCNSDFEVAKN